MVDSCNETQTIFRASAEPILTLIDNHTEQDESDVAVRASIAMKKPSMDFNAQAPGFMHKLSAQAQAQANQEAK